MVIITEKEELQILIDVSVMYYLENKTQNEIAKELYISRPKVSRLLKKAREQQVVDITINYQSDSIEKLQSKIKRKYNLNKVIIVKSLSDSGDNLREVGKAAATEFSNQIKEGMTLGISWGKSIRSTASNIKENKINDLKVVELLGAFSYEGDDSSALTIGRSILSKLGGNLYPLPAPLYIEDSNVRKNLVENPIIFQSLQMIESCDLILSGIGLIDNTSTDTIFQSFLGNDAMKRIIEKGAIGYICAHFLDKNGKIINDEINENIIGIKTETIKKIKNIIVACGKKKAKIILAVLRAGLINTLVSDEDTLRLVLEYDEKKK